MTLGMNEQDKNCIKKIQHGKFRFVLLMEIVLLIGCVIWCITAKEMVFELTFGEMRALEESGDVNYVSTPLALEKGAYRLQVQYLADSDMTNTVVVTSDQAGQSGLKTNETILYAGQKSTDYVFRVKRDLPDVQIRVNYGGQGTLQVGGGQIISTSYLQRSWLVYLIFASLLLDGCWLFVDKTKENAMVRKMGFALAGIWMISSIPAFLNYLYPGADMTFHLLRIEGVKDGLLSGQFPVRIHPNWLQGHGYAAGIFYSDLFLYFPAVLRIMGFTVQGAYLCYKVVINLGICLISFYSFTKLFGNAKTGLLGSFLYSLSLVHFIWMYGVDGVGQFTGMMFLPLVIYGYCKILFGDDTGKQWLGKNLWMQYLSQILPLTIGMSGLLESHVLTTEWTVFFLVVASLLFWKDFFQWKKLLLFAEAALLTVLLNAWYLVPFLDEMISLPLTVTNGGATWKQIQTWGMYLPQLFLGFPKGGLYGATQATAGMADETAYGVGIGLTIVLIVSIYFRKKWTAIYKKVLLLGLLSLWMSTIYFPWDYLAKVGGPVRSIIATLQFPYRITTFAMLFLVLLAMMVYQNGWNDRAYAWKVGFVILVCGGTMLSSWHYMDTMAQKSGRMEIIDETCMGNGYISGGEYVLLGTDTTKLTYKEPVYTESYVEFPKLYYKGYAAYAEDGTKLPVVIGENNVVRVELPDDYSGKVTLQFRGMWYWRVAEVVSLLMLGMIITIGHIDLKGRSEKSL